MKRLAIVFLILTALPARAAELVIVEADWCSWCRIWDKEIGVVYDQSPQAKLAPLRRIDIGDPLPDDLLFDSNPRVTPTFILFKNNREIARYEGYGGRQAFWDMLDGMLDQIPMPRRKVSYIRY
ncbi:MAG: thioredoxin family protein [Pseudomonadota bacterium]